MSLVQPSTIPQPWASEGQRTDIPSTTSESGRASWASGFPPENALPLNEGGVPPHWLDFQGVLYALSNHAFWTQSGARYSWDSSLDYPAGACIVGSDGYVYQALQASGPSAAGGAKNPTASGSSAYWDQLATADGTTITASSGKLSVRTAGIGASLADGTTITANSSTGKLSAQASALVDGTTLTVASGKAKVNPSAIADGTTIIVNSSGKLVGAAAKTASEYADGTTIVASNNKLSVSASGIADGTTIKVASGKLQAQIPATINGTSTRSTGDVTTAKWGTARNISIQDSDGTNTGTAVSVDGSAAKTLKLPATIKATLTGNASTATKWAAARNISIQDASGTNTGSAVAVDGSANKTLKLPATIKATLTGNADSATKLATARNFAVADATAKHTGAAVSFNGTAAATLKLPATITAALDGNAATATKATNDSDGKKISSTYAKLAGATFTGTVKVPTAAAGTNSTVAASTAFVTAALKYTLKYTWTASDGNKTISGCTVGKPIYIVHASLTGGGHSSCIVKVVSGSKGGVGAGYRIGCAEDIWGFAMSMVIIPTATSVVVNVSKAADDKDTLYVYV